MSRRSDERRAAWLAKQVAPSTIPTPSTSPPIAAHVFEITRDTDEWTALTFAEKLARYGYIDPRSPKR
jgi:hypothetical protein